ncbi:hypothetical protein Ahy_A04g020844 [Arachis hypogaea]|uniref:Auxin-induced protein n=1 Tax=Arachis hypogaea TaxID=3818 RepID=A0A445DIR1_ARAHY|nr:hypothetical protein Ahy_Scaffold6g108269 [Arachis hypogaea]RYQ79519.1 hypothetical protein Ahy_Scaffold6g108273 [Arachis hypogaea]RYR63058.1 hypothetical protein Ahy_A04g020844 [Arachis hypogaea]
MEQEECSDYVNEAHHYGCVPEGEPEPPSLLPLHFCFAFGITAKKWGKASFSAKQAISKSVQVPKGYLAVYVVDNQKRYLHSKSSSEVEEEFGYDHLMGGGYDHPIGGLTIPCSEHVFHQLASPLS